MNKKEQVKEQIREAFENKVDVEYIPPTIASPDETRAGEKTRVAPYCRVSTNSEDQLKSYEVQIQAYKEMVQNHQDWKLVDIYADEGISGTSLRHRDDFIRMIEDCKAGKIDMIITKNIARFARNVIDCVSTARMLKNMNPPVAIYFEDIGVNTLTQTGELLMVVMAAIAQGESEAKSTSVMWGFRKRFEAGLPKISPLYGYQKQGRDLYIIEEEAIIVRLMFQMYIDGSSIGQICLFLNSQGIPSPKQKLWSYSTVKNILSNEKYCGDVIMQKTISVDLFTHKTIKNDGRVGKYKVKDHHEPIISKEMWERVQERLALHAIRDSWDYWIEENNTDNQPRSLEGFSIIKMHKRRELNEHSRPI